MWNLLNALYRKPFNDKALGTLFKLGIKEFYWLGAEIKILTTLNPNNKQMLNMKIFYFIKILKAGNDPKKKTCFIIQTCQ